MPHCEFKKLPREEKMKWYIFVEEKGKDHQTKMKEMETKRKMDEMKKNSLPSPGLKS